MFNPSSTFHIDGKALGIDIEVDIRLHASDADASAVVGIVRPQRTLLVDIPNVQTLLISALNAALIRIQHMDAGINGASIQDIRIGRAKPAPPAEPYNPDTDGRLQ